MPSDGNLRRGELMPQVRLYDRSRVTTDWECPRKRYWQYEFGGKGIVPDTLALELMLGIALHDGLAVIATQTQKARQQANRDYLASEGKFTKEDEQAWSEDHVNIQEIANAAYKQVYDSLVEDSDEARYFAQEQATLIKGLLLGFYKHVWPALLARYPTIVAIEQEYLYKHANLGFMAKPDLVLEGKEGEIVYCEYKSSSSNDAAWINSWQTAIQLHATSRAIAESTKREVSAVIVQGLYKGYESYGKQGSVFCYAYKRSGNPPFTKDAVSYTYTAGMRRVPVWEMPGGVERWVEQMPEQILQDQFPQTPPIFPNESLVEQFFSQRRAREGAIEHAMAMLLHEDSSPIQPEVMDEYFPQRFDKCTTTWRRGKDCAYKRLCFGNCNNPLEAGYVTRIPHHQPELDQQETANAQSNPVVLQPAPDQIEG